MWPLPQCAPHMREFCSIVEVRNTDAYLVTSLREFETFLQYLLQRCHLPPFQSLSSISEHAKADHYTAAGSS
jgi:hypothetical protein